MPGIPQVYYVGLLAGANDVALLRRTQVGRDINRHYYDRNEIAAALEAPVVADLVRLIRLRNSHPAFGGEFSAHQPDSASIVLRWQHGTEYAELSVDFSTRDYAIRYSTDGRMGELRFQDAEHKPASAQQ